MLVNWFYTKMDLYSQPTYPNAKVYSLGYKINNHCNNKGLLGMKQQRTATGFLHTSAIQTQSAIFNYSILKSHELCMAVHTNESANA